MELGFAVDGIKGYNTLSYSTRTHLLLCRQLARTNRSASFFAASRLPWRTKEMLPLVGEELLLLLLLRIDAPGKKLLTLRGWMVVGQKSIFIIMFLLYSAFSIDPKYIV